jgi:hypothetical protein
MTWIVGAPTAFGYAVAISDIKATWRGRREEVAVQKLYPVGRDLAAGFAGSVQFGFRLVEDLRDCLRLDDPERVWKPRAAALKWYRRARRFFRQAGEDVKRLGSAVMLLGVSARQHIGLPGAALTTVAIMRSPDFVPQFLTPGTVDSIGCGALVAAYAKTLRDFTTEPFFWQAELMYPGANSYGRMLRHVIQQKIENHPEASVSPHLHLCIVRRGAVDITTSDHDTALYPSGQLVEWRMPRIATTWTEFETMTREAFGASADATAATA